VHAQGAENAFALTAVHSGIANIVTPHGIMAEVHRVIQPRRLSLERVPAVVERHVIPRADALVAISRFSRVSLSRDSRGRWFNIPNPVNPSFYSAEVGEPCGTSTYVFVGSIYPLKGLHTVVQAARLLDRRGIKGRVVVAGNAFNEKQRAYLDLCRDLSKELKSFVVEFRSWLGQDQLLGLFSEAKALIVASRTENAPMVAAEALAAGCPVISTPVGGLPEWIHHGWNGFLFPVDDADALATQIQQLEDLTSHVSIRQHCRQSANQFRPDRVASATVGMYEHLTMQRRPYRSLPL
jgi:glycosyltransferase involved in cell wall biosynthesis